MSYGQAVQWMPGITLEQMEKSIIEAAFRWYRGNKTQTAAALGISIRTLDNKLEKYEADARIERDNIAERKRKDADTLAHFRGKGVTDRFTVGGSNQWAEPPNPERDAAVAAIKVDERGQKSLSKNAEANGEPGNETSSGVRVEPTSQAGSEHPVPVSQRKEIQSVLPRPAGGVRSGRPR